MENLKHILIFKTNIRTDTDRIRVEGALNAHKKIERWNIDRHDIDCVLRIISPELQSNEIIVLINHCGYECSELM